jgi:homoserine O-acetyltransferase/O-succinyltransferase
MMDYQVFALGDVVLQSRQTLPDAQLAYKTYGSLNATRDNVIVYPTWYSGQHVENEWLIGPGRALDPANYFIIVPNMLGNGLSSSPSNTPPPWDRGNFPRVSVYDNVRLQHRLVTEQFGIEKIALVTGWSMGAMQAFHWAALYPEVVERILPFMGAARCSRHNRVFLEGLKAALTADAAFRDGGYESPPERGLRAFARVYAGWGLSQAFYRQRLDIEAMGFASLEDFLVSFWEGLFVGRDANNLLSMLWTWQNGDISAHDRFQGDFAKALGAIKAQAIVMPSSTDLYFPSADSEIEVNHMPNASLQVVDSIWGHLAGAPGTATVHVEIIDDALRRLLSRRGML